MCREHVGSHGNQYEFIPFLCQQLKWVILGLQISQGHSPKYCYKRDVYTSFNSEPTNTLTHSNLIESENDPKLLVAVVLIPPGLLCW